MRTLVTAIAASALLLGGGSAALADPQSNIIGTGSPHSTADRQFLLATYYDDETRPVQDAAIRLARTQCDYLTTVGNSPDDHIYLAETASETVEYPYLFLRAAIEAYCPQHRR